MWFCFCAVFYTSREDDENYGETEEESRPVVRVYAKFEIHDFSFELQRLKGIRVHRGRGAEGNELLEVCACLYEVPAPLSKRARSKIAHPGIVPQFGTVQTARSKPFRTEAAFPTWQRPSGIVVQPSRRTVTESQEARSNKRALKIKYIRVVGSEQDLLVHSPLSWPRSE